MIIQLCVAGVIPPGGSWWTEDAATVITAVAVINEQNAEARKRGKR